MWQKALSAASIDIVGTSGRSNRGGVGETRRDADTEVVETTPVPPPRSRYPARLPRGSRIYSALSRTISMAFEDRDPTEEMTTRGRRLVATDEATVIAKVRPGPIVVENSQGDGSLADPSSTDESH